MYRSTNMSVHQAMSRHDHATCQDVEKPRKSLELSSSLKTTMAFIYGSLRAGQFCAPITARQVVTCFSEPIRSLEMAGFLWQQNLLLIKVSESNPESDWVGLLPGFRRHGWSDWQPSLIIGNRSIAILEILSNREGQVVPGHEGPAIYCTSAGGILESGGG